VDAGHVLFQHVASRSDDEIDLAAAALLIAEVEYPGLDVAHYLGLLDGMADVVRARGGAPSGGADALLRALNHHLYEELGFRGNEEDYYDPKNSFLNEVIDRRIGIPITLSVIYLEVGRRVGLELDGVSFPGHFLVQHRTDQGAKAVLDPYHGGLALDREELEERLKRAIGQETQLSPEHLQIASKRNILTRMLNNLRGIYQRANDVPRERGCLEKLSILNPQDTRVGEALVALRRRGGEAN
jgi:regulator of sirC expression with transglutaminase-like and TPR domain